jgi:hypothetical protein
MIVTQELLTEVWTCPTYRREGIADLYLEIAATDEACSLPSAT